MFQDQAGRASKPILLRNKGSYTQLTYHGFRRQGTDCTQDSMAQEVVSSPAFILILFYSTSVGRRKKGCVSGDNEFVNTGFDI